MAHRIRKVTDQSTEGGLRKASGAKKPAVVTVIGEFVPHGTGALVASEPIEAWAGNPRDMRDEDLAFFGLKR